MLLLKVNLFDHCPGSIVAVEGGVCNRLSVLVDFRLIYSLIYSKKIVRAAPGVKTGGMRR